MKDNVILDRSKNFALRIVRMYRHLCEKKNEYVLSKQILRSGTSIGANVREAQRAQSLKDFVAKMHIALKEADETAYWLELLHGSKYLTPKEFESIYAECQEILCLLTKIIKSGKRVSDE